MNEPGRRARISAEVAAATGINETLIENLVRSFYSRVWKDQLLAPIFDAHIEDWERHLQRMFAFWSSVTLMSGRYHGQPMAKHLPLPIDGRHFDRWLSLFEQTAYELCPPDAAAYFIERSRRIAGSLELGIASSQGVMLQKGQRLWRQEVGAGRQECSDDALGGGDEAYHI